MVVRPLPCRLEALVQNPITVSLAQSLQIAGLAAEEATRLGIEVSIVVLDPHGRRKLVHRMDGATLMAESIARDKAFTVVGMGGAPTSQWESAGAASPALAAQLTSITGFMPFGGGEALWLDGSLIGAVGVSGGTMEQDVMVARHATTSLGMGAG